MLKTLDMKAVAVLNWVSADSEGSLSSKGKRDYYLIIIRGIPEDHPKDGIVELYATAKPAKAFDIKIRAESGQIKPLSRTILWGNLPPATSILEIVESMKETAEKREKEMPLT